MCLVNGETTYYIVRFLLGAAEAGFFPAILFYLTLWFPAAQRVTVLGIFILAQPVSNALGAPVSGHAAADGRRHGPPGLAVALHPRRHPGDRSWACSHPILMTDRPRDAKWLEADERNGSPPPWTPNWPPSEVGQATTSWPASRTSAPWSTRPVLRPGLRHLRPGPVDAHHRRGAGQVLHRRGRLHRLHPLRHRRSIRLLLEQARGPDRQACLARRGQHGACGRRARGRRLPAAGQPVLAMVGPDALGHGHLRRRSPPSSRCPPRP